MPLRRVASQFGTSDATLRRHKQNCMKVAIAAVQEEQRAVQVEQTARSGWNALSEMQWLHDEARKLYQEVRGSDSGKGGEREREKGDPRLALATLGEIRKQTQLFGELLKGAEEASQAEREKEWINLREVIFTALEPYPDARLAVARALLALGEQHDDRNAGQQLG
jgi:hypothetical protein